MLWVSLFPSVKSEKEHFSPYSLPAHTQCAFCDIFLIFCFEIILDEKSKKKKKEKEKQNQ